MYFTTHLLAGAVVGKLTGSPVIGGALGLASHAVLDAVPHHDYYRIPYGLLDTVIGTAIGLIFLWHRGPAVISASLCAVLPDLEVVIRQLAPNWPAVFPSHNGLTPHRRLKWPWGFIIQLLLGAIFFVFIVS